MTDYKVVPYKFHDGGRKDAGYKGNAGDCVTRAIAIATGKPYQEVYDALSDGMLKYSSTKRTKVARAIQRKSTSPRNGCYRVIYQSYLESIGWKWVPTMFPGQGCKVHLVPEELPRGKVIARVSKHICAMVDGVIYDTHNPSRGGTRCVYGYFMEK